MKQLSFIFLLTVLFSTNALLAQSSSHRKLYVSTVAQEQYDAVYEILQGAFDDFPTDEDNRIKYKSTTEEERLVIVLRDNYVRLFYRSRDQEQTEMSKKVDKIKQKIGLLEEQEVDVTR